MGERSRPLTTAQVAAILGKSERRIRQYIEDGSIEAEKIGGVWLIEAEAVEEAKKRKDRRRRRYGQ